MNPIGTTVENAIRLQAVNAVLLSLCDSLEIPQEGFVAYSHSVSRSSSYQIRLLRCGHFVTCFVANRHVRISDDRHVLLDGAVASVVQDLRQFALCEFDYVAEAFDALRVEQDREEEAIAFS